MKDVDIKFKKHMMSAQMAAAFEWQKWINELPYLNFPKDWHVKIIPPVVGAIIRFHIKKDLSKEGNVSVYLDCYYQLGYCGGKPYWEIYPHDGETYRCLMENTDELLKAIGEALEKL